jgi:hypothetical protein
MPAPVRTCHDGTLSGFWAILLLVLAVSPVTAPFSSCDVENLFSDSHVTRAMLQSKVVEEKPVDGVPEGVVPHAGSHASLEPCAAGAAAPVQGFAAWQFPLRI